MIFVDTGAWYAALVQEDPAHKACRELLISTTDRLVTTYFVFDELLTLLVIRGDREIATQIGPKLLQEDIADLHWITVQNFNTAWDVFARFADKHWSFTDCTSYTVMQELKISEAFALDQHFHQFGFVTIKP